MTQSYRCRCQRKACEARVTLRMHPSHYVRPPRCRMCGSPCSCGKRKYHRPKPATETRKACVRPSLRVDKYRQTRELKLMRKHVCNPGRGGCDGYSFPHFKGRGWCMYNARKTEAQWQEHLETGGRYA